MQYTAWRDTHQHAHRAISITLLVLVIFSAGYISGCQG